MESERLSPADLPIADVISGEGSTIRLCKRLIGRRVCVVHGYSYERGPIRSILERMIDSSHLSDCGNWRMAPTIDDTANLSQVVARLHVDVVIAVGGGGILDLCKAACGTLRERPVLVAIPTTAGSGSEATPYASLLQRQSYGWEKVTVTNRHQLPDIIVLDPVGVVSLPARQRAISSLDALSQAVESYWCFYATSATRELSLKSISLLREHMEEFQRGQNRYIGRMLNAAYLAGRAIAIAPTNICHAISYPLTSQFGVPHGWAVAFTLSRAIQLFEEVAGPHAAPLCTAFQAASLVDVATWVDQLRASSGLSCHLSDWGIREQHLESIVAKSYRPDRMQLAPRQIVPAELKRILRELL